MRKVKAFIFRAKDDDEGTTIVIMEDGGVANAYNPDEYYRTEYYQNRITSETTLDNMWEELGEGKMYTTDWDGTNDEHELFVDNLTQENFDKLIDDMIDWLYCSTEEHEIVKIEMGELTDESYEKVKEQLIFEEE